MDRTGSHRFGVLPWLENLLAVQNARSRLRIQMLNDIQRVVIEGGIPDSILYPIRSEERRVGKECRL